MAGDASCRCEGTLAKGCREHQDQSPRGGHLSDDYHCKCHEEGERSEIGYGVRELRLSKTWQEIFATNCIYAPTVRNAVLPKDFKYGALLVQNDEFQRLFLPDPDKIAERKADWLDQLGRLGVLTRDQRSLPLAG